MSLSCPKCHSTAITKNGHNNHKQNYLCHSCHRQFLENRSKPEISEQTKQQVRALLCERLSLRAICRLTGTSLTWLRYFLKKEAEKVPNHLHCQTIVRPETVSVLSLQINELWTYVQKKLKLCGYGLF